MTSSSIFFASWSRKVCRAPSAEQPIAATPRCPTLLAPVYPFSTLLILCLGLVGSADVFAHGFAGKRLFPATPVTDDPFVADELSLPTISSRKLPASGDEPATRETDFSVDLAKRVTDNFGIGLGATYKRLRPDDGETQRGFDNLAASIKYKFYHSNEHETILSAGIDWDIGNSGSKRVGAETFSTFTPTLFFGKGLVDLLADMTFLRPLALTGLVGVGIPSRASTTMVSD